jgi:hypothetical protein
VDNCPIIRDLKHHTLGAQIASRDFLAGRYTKLAPCGMTLWVVAPFRSVAEVGNRNGGRGSTFRIEGKMGNI